jgi:hypothetical protein
MPRVDEQAVEEQTVRDESAGADAGPDGESGVGGIVAGVLAGLGLIWLAATLVVSHASVVGNAQTPDVALGAAAFALPNLVAAALLAGSATALLATATPLARFFGGQTPARRLLAGLAGGAVLGGLCGALVVFGYGTYSRVEALALTIGVAALLGGAAAVLPRPVLAASVLACLGVLVLGLVVGFVQPGLVGLFGAGTSLDSQVNAGWLLAYTVAIVGGIVAGLLAFRFLRGHGPRPWPWFLLAGGLPGLLLLLTEALTRIGGAGLLNAVRGLSEGDQFAVDLAEFSRLRNAMVVFFVGGLAAMIAVGRTLGPGPEPAADDAPPPDEAPQLDDERQLDDARQLDEARDSDEPMR